MSRNTIGVTDMAKRYHSRGRIAVSFVSVCDKLCIRSVTSLGFPYYYEWVSPKTLKGRSIVSDNSPDGCRSPRLRKRLISHVLFSTPTGRGTVLTAGTAPLGLYERKTDLELCLVSQRTKPKTVQKQTAGKRHT